MTVPVPSPLFNFPFNGALAQLVERLHGMQEVVGSSPIGSTIQNRPSSFGKAAGLLGPLEADP